MTPTLTDIRGNAAIFIRKARAMEAIAKLAERGIKAAPMTYRHGPDYGFMVVAASSGTHTVPGAPLYVAD